ncbi:MULTISPECIES: fibronectin type III domain-containing protein [unclassified Myroides]|uniref:fibronectin type III domain-containing protein n=1 Tax=unclassified Myroides TaxID=2642485 RepID=UPI003D2F7921
MKKITMLFLLLFGAWLSYGQEVTIGTGTETERRPLSSHYGYSRSAALYTATEIGETGFINKLAWDIGAIKGQRPVKIYLKEVQSTAITIDVWETFTEGATLVFDGAFTPSVIGFNTINFDASFNYTGGTNNLLVLVETNFGGGGNSDGYDGLMIKASTETNMHFGVERDNSLPEANLTAISTRPNLKITFGTEITCPSVTPTILRVTSTSLTFNVTERETTQSIYYEVRTAGAAGSGATGLVTSDTVTDLTTFPVEVTDLAANTNYTLYVRASCGVDNESIFSDAFEFTTAEAGVIGGGSRQDSYLPIYSTNAFNLSQMIYTAEEIGGVLEDKRLVERIKFYYTGTGTVANFNTWKVYLTNTAKEAFTGTSASDWIAHDEFTQVFEGTVTLAANSWTEIIFDSAFVWDGESNLAIAVYEDAPGWSSGARFATFPTDTYRGILRSSDTFYTPDGGHASAYGRYQYLPKLFIDGVVPPSCYMPVNGRVGTVAANNAQIQWSILENTESIGIDYYLSTSDTAPTATTGATGTIESEDQRSLTIEGLEENTTYYVWLRNICEDNTKTDWIARPIVVKTPLVPASLPYSEDFEDEVNMVFVQDLINKWFIGEAVSNGGDRSLYISNDNGVSNAYTFSGGQVSHAYKDFEIPANTNEISIAFDWRCVGELSNYDRFRVWLVPTTYIPTARTQITSGTNRTQVGRENYNGNNEFLSEYIIADASAFAGQTMRLVFEWRQDSGTGNNPPAAIDNLNIEVITCSQPRNLETEDITENSIDVSWGEVGNASSYELYISTSNTAPTDTATVVNTQETTHTFEDLEANTYYYIWVRSKCTDTDFSLWTGPLAVSTALVPVDLPYSDTFETAQEYAFRNHGVNKWHIGTAVNNGGTSALYISNNDGVANTYTNSVTQVSHVYKDFTIPADAEELEIQFDWRSLGDSYSGDGFTVWAVPVTFEPTEGVGITTAATRVRLGRSLYEQNRNFVTERLVMNETAFAGQTMRLVFQWKNDSWGGENPPAAIDNLKLNYSTCIQPTNLVSDTVTATSIKANWTGVTGVTNYEVKITTTPAVPAETVAGTTVSTTTHTFSGLTSNTTYYIWVRSLCSTTNKSLWTGPLRATTNLIPVDLPFRDDFETTQPYATVNDILNKWHIGNATNYGGQRALYISGDEGVSNVYLNNNKNQVSHVYKDFVIPADAAELAVNFDWRCLGDGSGSYPYDYFRVWLVPLTYVPSEGVQTTTTNSGGVQIGRPFYNRSSSFLNERLVLNGTTYQGQTMRLLFEWKNNTYGEYQPPAAIDNLEVHVITCPEPTDVQIDELSESTITVSWTPVEGQDTYEVYYSTANGLPGQTVTGSVTTTETSYTIEELTDNTEYYIWVRTICSATNKSSWVRVVAITSQIPAEMPFDENFEGENNWTIGFSPINKWFIGAAANNGGRNGLYITNDEGLTNAYDINVETITHAYRDIAVPEGTTDCLLTFDWRCFGDGFVSTKYDFFKVWLVPVTYTPTTGQLITSEVNRTLVGAYNNEEEFVTDLEEVINLAAYADGTVRLVFEWVQNAYSGNQPPAAIDNIKITPITCPAVLNLGSEVMEGAPSRVLLTWEAQGDETQWEVYIVPLDDVTPPVDNTTGIVVDTNSYVYVNPNPAAEDQFYRFYVRPLCSDTDTGRWSEAGIISFIPPPGCANVDADIEFSELEGLEKNAKGEYIICEKGTFNFELGASYYDILKTDSYRVDPIDYNPPFPFKGGGAIELTADDIWSDVIELGFDFCFYGNKYDKILINTNGTITFDIQGITPNGRYRPGSGGAPYNPVSQIPSDPGANNPTTSSGPTINSIMGVFQDTHPGIGDRSPADRSINYQIIGKAPCRTLVFNVYHLGMYGSRCTFDPDDVENTTQTSQIVMYEGTNIIEVYVRNRHADCNEWGRNAIIGIQNADGSDGIAPPGRNTGPWEAQNEAWRFTPDGDSTAEFFWEKNGEFYSTDAKIDVEVSETVTYTAKAKYEICGDETVLYKEFKFVKEDFTIGTPTELFDCSRPIGEKNFVDLSENDSLVLNGVDPEKYIIEYFESEEDMNTSVGALDSIYEFNSSRLLYVRLTNKRTGCSEFKTFKVTIQPPLEVAIIENQSVCGAYTFPETKNGESYYTQELGQGDRYEGGDSFDTLGIHTIYVFRSDERGCMGQSSFTLEVVEQPVADDIADQVMFCDIYFLPEPSKYNKYFTQPGGKGEELTAGIPIIKPQTIYVYAYNKGLRGAECMDEKSFTVTYEECPIPRGISPNGDGINESFDLSKHGISKIQIFNRNGVEVYSHGMGYKNEWFGQNNSNKLLPVGTYYYVVVSNGKVRTGWVQLNY